jgi:pimeloyl-ACP methyl ester carboxylesterase
MDALCSGMFGTVAFVIATVVCDPPFSGQAAGASSVGALTLTIRDPQVGRLSFQDLAAGDPAAAGRGRLVPFLHGFPETAESFRQILPAVASAGYYAVVAPCGWRDGDKLVETAGRA